MNLRKFKIISPIKINDYTISNPFGSDDMLIDKHSKIEVLKNASFEPVQY